jgi:hypothetical protein
MRSWLLVSMLLVGSAGVAGCGAVSGGATVVKYKHNGPLIMNEAPSDGAYGLYGTYDGNKQVEYVLKKGERLGFVERDGQKFAVAGKNEVPIKTNMVSRSVYWNRVGE